MKRERFSVAKTVALRNGFEFDNDFVLFFRHRSYVLIF